MLMFEWNALGAGDHVMVHNPASKDMVLLDGVVASVDSRQGGNGVGIRVDAPGGDTTILWPSHLVVHSQPSDPTDACWRCHELSERSTPQPTAPNPPASRTPEPSVTPDRLS